MFASVVVAVSIAGVGSPSCSAALKNISMIGETLKSYPGVSSPEACCALCYTVKNCSSFTVHASTCDLKATDRVAPVSGSISGLRLPPSPPPPPPTPPTPCSGTSSGECAANETCCRYTSTAACCSAGTTCCHVDGCCGAYAICLYNGGICAPPGSTECQYPQVCKPGEVCKDYQCKPSTGVEMTLTIE